MYFFNKHIRIILTTIVIGFFFFFWINGPLLKELQGINTESIFNEYSISKLVGEKKRGEVMGR